LKVEKLRRTKKIAEDPDVAIEAVPGAGRFKL
jgi:hypothetical protein